MFLKVLPGSIFARHVRGMTAVTASVAVLESAATKSSYRNFGRFAPVRPFPDCAVYEPLSGIRKFVCSAVLVTGRFRLKTAVTVVVPMRVVPMRVVLMRVVPRLRSRTGKVCWKQPWQMARNAGP